MTRDLGAGEPTIHETDHADESDEAAVAAAGAAESADLAAEFERDPWGIVPLLAAQPEPGPMPERVEERIWDAIGEFDASQDGVDIFGVSARVESDGGLVDELGLTSTEFVDGYDDHGSGTRAVTGRHTSRGAGRAPAGGPRVVSLRGSVRRSGGADGAAAVFLRRRALAALVAAAAVVLLVLGGGTLIRSALGTDSGPASKAVSTLPIPTADAPLTARLHVEASARTYTHANLATLAQELLEVPGTAYSAAPDSPDAMPVTTASGLNGCLFALGELDADRIAVDLATYEGAPAAIVVVIDGGLKQVYAVQRTCTKGNPHVVDGPLPMT